MLNQDGRYSWSEHHRRKRIKRLWLGLAVLAALIVGGVALKSSDARCNNFCTGMCTSSAGCFDGCSCIAGMCS
jgi:hypothetical protein